MARPTVCETRWVAIISSFERNSEQLAGNHPDCTEDIALLHTGLKTIGQLILKSPPVNGNGSTWKELLDKAESERAVLCKHLDGKALFTAMLRMYAAIYRGCETRSSSGKSTVRTSASKRGGSGSPPRSIHETRQQPYARILWLHPKVMYQPGTSPLH
jgi:hypothetical protein